MVADAERYVASCGRCQHVAAGTRVFPVGRMTPFLYPAPNHTLFIDFFGPLPICSRASPLDTTGAKHDYEYIITLVDGYSRFAIFLPSTHKSAAAAVAALRHWYTFYGAPLNVRTDSDKAFESSLFAAALRTIGAVHDPVPPYTHHLMGLLERAHKPLADLLRKLGGHASAEWVDLMPTIMAWRNSSVNRDLGACPHEIFFCRKPSFAYDRLGVNDASYITPNELGNISAALDVLVRTSASVSSAMVAAQYDNARSAPPEFSIGDTVLVYFPDRENKCLTFFRGPFSILSQADESGNYYNVRDLVQHTEYTVHVERLKSFDMSRTTVEEQAERQLPSRDFGIIVGVDSHRMNDAHGLYEFCIRFYSGYRAWQLFPYVQNLDVVKSYIAEHRLNTRKQTPAQQLNRLTGLNPAISRPPPNRTPQPTAAAVSSASSTRAIVPQPAQPEPASGRKPPVVRRSPRSSHP
jgi:hypothetical protein